jgi:hypothetical protein
VTWRRPNRDLDTIMTAVIGFGLLLAAFEIWRLFQ